jgi:hypothetical protein
VQCSPLEGPRSEEPAVPVNLDTFITMSKFGLNLQQFSTDLNSALFGLVDFWWIAYDLEARIANSGLGKNVVQARFQGFSEPRY